MPFTIKNLSVQQSIDAINAFICFMKLSGMDEKLALNELVLYFIHHRRADSLLTYSLQKEVTEIKEICNAKDLTTSSNFLRALTTLCHQYVVHGPLSRIVEGRNMHPSIIVASFHHALIHPETPLILEINLDDFAKISYDKRAVLLFCIKVFVPELIITCDFISKDSAISHLSDIVNSLSVPTSFTYKNCELGLIQAEQMNVLWASIKKAERLVLDGANLDQWTRVDFRNFVDAIKSNPQINSLSLAKTQLHKCCKDSAKFECILELINLPQLNELNLHHNRLSYIATGDLNRINKAIKESPIEDIGLNSTGDRKGTLSGSGIFALPALTSDVVATKKTEPSPKLELESEGSLLSPKR